MQRFFTVKKLIITALVLAGVSGGALWFYSSANKAPTWTTEKVTRGTVENIIAVSGVVEAANTADLAFPVGGIVATIDVQEGDNVTVGQLLATLEQTELAAERRDAAASLAIAQADQAELIAGPTAEARDITSLAVEIAAAELERITADEQKKVERTERILRSSDVEMVPVNKSNNDTPPTVSGTYTCTNEGVYTLSVFRSSAQSGYSYRLSGLESGTFPAYTESAAPLGTCGLSIQFDDTENYSSSDWVIMIPNTQGASYATNVSALLVTKQQADNAIAAATQALEKARRESVLENAVPRTEELSRADARITQAEARLAQIDARLSDRTLRAPFAGIINNIDVIKGETVGTAPVITMVAADTFTMTVRIPEIDIAKVQVGQETRVLFDANPKETVPGTITFIAPLATMIDGVAYFEATISFPTPPTWLRGGLNADVDIIVNRAENVLRIPKRFLIERGDTVSVLVPNSENTTNEQSAELGFVGNDGYVEIIGLAEGATIVAP